MQIQHLDIKLQHKEVLKDSLELQNFQTNAIYIYIYIYSSFLQICIMRKFYKCKNIRKTPKMTSFKSRLSASFILIMQKTRRRRKSQNSTIIYNPWYIQLVIILFLFNATNNIPNIKTKHQFLYISHYRLFHTSVL